MTPRVRLLAAFSAAALLGSPRIPSVLARESTAEAPKSHPTVKLDLLDLSRAPDAVPEEAYLRQTLGQEARRAEWGAGRGAHIQYRVRVDELSVTEDSGVLHVSCSATGWLPKGRIAKSHLAFGGALKDRAGLVRRVLEIVARGVVTRLAELERKRRAQSR